MKTMAVIYVRVSSQKQLKEGDGLASQQARCEEFARNRNYIISKIFKDDASGSLINRPGMKAMLAFLRGNRKHNPVVIIDDISRLARGLEAHLQLRADIAKAGGRLESPSIEFGEDSDSKLVENLLASVSQHQRQKNGEQTRNRMRGRLLNGHWSFKAPIGYKFVRHAEHGKHLVRDEPMASLIAEIFEGYASGRFSGQAEIVRYLENNPGWPRERRNHLTVERVTEILTRVLYAGYIDPPPAWEVSMRPGKHEAIISLATFNAVQEKMKANAKVPARKDINTEFPLRNFVTCECGTPYTACWARGRSQSYPYYLCQAKGCASYGKSIRREKLEAEFEELLTQLCPKPELVELAATLFRDLWDARVAQQEDDRTRLRQEVTRIERQIEQLVDRIINADSPALTSAYENRVRSLETEKAEIAEKMSNCGRVLPEFDDHFRTALEFLKNPKTLWYSKALEDKRALLKLAFADKITYKRNEGFRTAETAAPFRVCAGFTGLDFNKSEMVRMVGLEPTCIATADFESAASTISPHPRGNDAYNASAIRCKSLCLNIAGSRRAGSNP